MGRGFRHYAGSLFLLKKYYVIIKKTTNREKIKNKGEKDGRDIDSG